MFKIAGVNYTKNNLPRAAVAQEVERVVHYPEGQWLDPMLLQSALRIVLGKDSQPQISPVCEWLVTEKVQHIISLCEYI